MNTTDRLTKIASVAENVANTKKAEEIAKQNEKQALIDLIASYAERIKALIEVGSALVKNKMPLGESDRFQASGLDHRFGFMVEGNRIISPDKWKIIGIGREGSGWADNDFLVNDEGVVIEYADIYTCESWTKKFEEFEEAFYNYVDNEI